MANIFDIPITQIATDLEIKKSGPNKYHCFNHGKEDKSPSLVMYDPGWFKCASCHIEGGRYELVQFKLKLKDRNEARDWLNKKYKLSTNHSEKKVHIRFIQNTSKKEEHRFIFLPERDLFLREPNEADIDGIKSKLHKNLSLQTLISAGIKIADRINKQNWPGLVFTPNLKSNGILFNPKNIQDKYLHFEGRTDWLTGVEMGWGQEFALVSDYNKSSFNVFPKALNIFILDRDTEEDFILDKIKEKCREECRVQFIRLSEKDLSDLWYKKKNSAHEEIKNQLDFNPVYDLLGDGLTVEQIFEQAKEDLINIDDAELEPIPIISIGKHLLLSQGNIGLIAGSEGVMKSTLARMMVAGSIRHEKAKTWTNFADIRVAQNKDKKAVLFFDSEQSKHRQGKNLKEMLGRSKNKDIPEHFYNFDFVSKAPDEFLQRFRNYTKALSRLHNGIFLIVIDQLGDMLANINDIAEVKVLMNELREISRDYTCGIVGIIHFNPKSDKERGHIGTELRQKAEFNVFVKRDPNTGVSELHIRKAREANEWDIPIMMFSWDKESNMVVDRGYKSRTDSEGSQFSKIIRDCYNSREDQGLTNKEVYDYFLSKNMVKNKNQFNRIMKKIVDRYELLRKEGDGRETRYFIHEDVLISEHKNEEIKWDKK